MKIEEIKKQIHDLVGQIFKEGFKEGYNYCNTEHFNTNEYMYEKGLNDAWECARKICSSKGFPLKKINKIFGSRWVPIIMSEYSASEAIARIKAFEEREQAEEEDQEWGTMEERLAALAESEETK